MQKADGLTTLPARQHLSSCAVAWQVAWRAGTLSQLVVRAGKVQVELLPVDGLPQGPYGFPEPLLRASAHAAQVAALC